ncbi:hypothetical protein AURDEDRAFT_178436 [Auricularia subglabra TFB-10046 SS5]|uniref:Uncharacterized protein n=1 Tax=Auricularia subglabra (strain TFB-10046 / SS5) TaxID=717982 RepID=J0WJP1_AURST|nr:hypothetical protein AURDEDRAFT_178436 [Auricularia subglabra TFB-10046 SS5]
MLGSDFRALPRRFEALKHLLPEPLVLVHLQYLVALQHARMAFGVAVHALVGLLVPRRLGASVIEMSQG